MNTLQERKDEQRWEQLSLRSPAGTGKTTGKDTFVYAVRTTGVFCLPGCPSRIPKRENVQFFDTTAQARQAGFRPCKRCEPEKSVDTTAEMIGCACRMIEKSMGTISLTELAGSLNLSSYHFLRMFKKHVGTTPKQYALAKKRQHMQSRLTEGTSVTEAIHEAGFGSTSRAYESIAGSGMSPGDYRRGGKGISVRYSMATCSLGFVLVAATEKGICCIELGESRRELESALKSRFPNATISEDQQNLQQLVSEVLAFIDAPRDICRLPLDIQGTAFQMRVWNELRRIPAGTTTTYAEIAGRINKPEAVRAVAGAIAANKIAVLIPCHRVIGKTGDLTGYRWGLKRKRQILDSEHEL